MWYFTWVLGVGFAVLLAILNAMWGENEEGRAGSPEGVPKRDRSRSER
jgi:cytochrome bd-I ubiquinol oxidase subunit X